MRGLAEGEGVAVVRTIRRTSRCRENAPLCVVAILAIRRWRIGLSGI